MGNASKSRAKMPISQRAKQFMPFDAVSGLRQALRMKEHEMGLISRKELSEETQDSINETLNILEPGDRVSVAYFSREAGEEDSGEIIYVEGGLCGLDTMSKKITIMPDDPETDMHGFTEEYVIDISDIASISRVDDDMS